MGIERVLMTVLMRGSQERSRLAIWRLICFNAGALGGHVAAGIGRVMLGALPALAEWRVELALWDGALRGDAHEKSHAAHRRHGFLILAEQAGFEPAVGY